ncbi:MAG: hypothetical protein GTO02_02285, partial [Candidatus Dadabacteria bacterium]|nr:hypothetical protein [Candidatus Dadabacteria bacterium]
MRKEILHLIIFFLFSTSVYALASDLSVKTTGFDQGTYFNTTLSLSTFVELNLTFVNGSYYSKIFDLSASETGDFNATLKELRFAQDM